MIVSWPLERTCWRQFAAQRGDCKKSRTAPLNYSSILLLLQTGKHRLKEAESESDRQTDRQTQRQTRGERHAERERQTERDRERLRDGERERETEKNADRHIKE